MVMGIYSDDEINLLKRVLDARCSSLKVDPESAEGQHIASQLLDLYSKGVRDENALLERVISVI